MDIDPDVSDANAFKVAGALCLSNAVREGGPSLLEPIMQLEILVPGDYLSGVIADLNGRRAKINDVGSRGHLQCIQAEGPLSELFGYTTSLRSVSQGRGTYTMRFSRYEMAPEQTVQKMTGMSL